MKILYCGSFNPFHSGHQYVFDVACKCFGKGNVWIGIGVNPDKKTIDPEHLKRSIHPITRNVIAYSCLTAEVVKKEGFDLLVRGIRPGHNLDDENDLLYWNRKLCGVETILIPTPPELNQVSSGAIRVLSAHNQDVSELVNPFVFARWNSGGPKYTVYFGRCCSGKSTYLQNPRISRFDEIIWEQIKENRGDVESLKEEARKAFYSKDTKAFLNLIKDFGWIADWESMFWNFSIIDFPNLGSYWDYIPENILQQCKFVKISTSMENRQYFASCRKANLFLIETSDFFYKDPPFWDEEIMIEKKPY